jgi:hypothetical protein
MFSSFKGTVTALFIGLFTASSGVAQVFWSSQTTSAIPDDIWSVTFANGMFAAATASGNVITSPDGVTWTSHPALAGTWLVSVAYGNGLWVAVGANGTILSTADLSVWTPHLSMTTNKLNGVFFTGYIFVAVGDGGTILTSADGLTWNPQVSGVTGFLHGITYAPGLIISGLAPNRDTVFVTGQGGVVLSAQAGERYGIPPPTTALSFSQTRSPTSQDLEAILYPSAVAPYNSMVAVGANGALVNTESPLGGFSSVGTSTPATTATFRGLAYGNGGYVAAGD